MDIITISDIRKSFERREIKTDVEKIIEFYYAGVELDEGTEELRVNLHAAWKYQIKYYPDRESAINRIIDDFNVDVSTANRWLKKAAILYGELDQVDQKAVKLILIKREQDWIKRLEPFVEKHPRYAGEIGKARDRINKLADAYKSVLENPPILPIPDYETISDSDEYIEYLEAEEKENIPKEGD